MIKAKCNNGDLIFGLSEENVTRLKKGEPIVFNLSKLGLEDRRVMICYGKTEQHIYEEFKEHLTNKPIIHIKDGEN